MDITVRGNHETLSESLRRFAVGKAEHLGKYLSTIDTIEVELDRDGRPTGAGGHVVRITAATSGPVFRSKATSGDPHAAIDLAVERLSRRLKEFKRRRSGRPLHARSKPASGGLSKSEAEELLNETPDAIEPSGLDE
ncbi:MAG: ribosome hibernation-promoting factor, HPF/YfiA family [Actinomycetota bacterium]